jgi:hypothetical protein
VRSIVIAPASTGRESNNNKAVMKIDQQSILIRSKEIFLLRMLAIVVIKLIAPKIEDTPARWREKIAKSTEPPPCAILEDKGG